MIRAISQALLLAAAISVMMVTAAVASPNRLEAPQVSVPAPECQLPERRSQADREQMWDEFMMQTDAYRDCMNRYIRYHHAASNAHRAAANAATEQWNQFVRDSMNVPQDFPWPPAE